MAKKLLLLHLLFIPIISVAQNDHKPFYGTIYDELGTLSRAHIINISTKKATYSNEQGEFRIFVKISDSLKITSVGYKTLYLKVSENHLGITQNSFTLTKEIIELDEIEVKKHNLIGSISSDVKTIKHKKLINASTLKLPNANKRKFTVAERRLYTASGGGNILSLDLWINTLNGEIKRLKKLKKTERNEQEIKYLKSNFTSYLQNDLKVDTLKVSALIYFIQEDPQYNKHKANGEFELIKFIKNKTIAFKKINDAFKE